MGIVSISIAVYTTNLEFRQGVFLINILKYLT